jgi:ABC-type transporter Mla MlaB component
MLKTTFRAEIQWLTSGPTLKLEGRLAADWAEQARSLVTKDVVPKGLIVDLTKVSYVDSMGERLLKWLASMEAVFAAGGAYSFAVCERLCLPVAQRINVRGKGNGRLGARFSTTPIPFRVV